MGKAGRWLRNLFLPGRKGRKAKDRAADADCQSVLSAPLPSHSQAAAPSTGREKRRWSFRRPGAATAGGAQGPLASSSSHCFSEVEVRVVVAQEQEQDHHQQQEEVAAAVPETASAAGTVVTLPASGRTTAAAGGRDGDVAAAVRIQSAFRSYLARKALCALRGMVRLQAMVRGQLVRRQANLTLRRMQALVHAQRRARAERLRLLELELEDDVSRQHAAAATTTSTTTPRPPPCRRSPQHLRSRKPPAETERGGGSEENNVRIVEVDDGAPRAGARRSSSGCCHCSTSTTTPSRTPAKPDPCQKVSPTPSALTDASARTLSGRLALDDASFTSASEPTSMSVPSRRNVWHAADPTFFFFPSYMANTESSRAKARSQSAPRQRLSSASDTALLVAAASPSPSCCDRPPSRGGCGGGGSARRRA